MAFLMVLVINVLLAGLIFYKIINRPKPEYFATTSDGRIVKLSTLTTPELTDAELLQFVSQAAIAAYTYDYVNYRQALQSTSDYFTARGWKDFQEAIRRSKRLETLITGKYVGHATPTGAPVIIDRGVISGRYSWKVRMPLLATLENVRHKIPQPLDITMVITRVPILTAPKGVEISSFIASERRLS